jgi:hypothetical protein
MFHFAVVRLLLLLVTWVKEREGVVIVVCAVEKRKYMSYVDGASVARIDFLQYTAQQRRMVKRGCAAGKYSVAI